MTILTNRDVIKIKKSKEGSLTRIAKRENGLLKNGKISKTWARAKLKAKGTTEAVKKKIRFFLNFNK